MKVKDCQKYFQKILNIETRLLKGNYTDKDIRDLKKYADMGIALAQIDYAQFLFKQGADLPVIFFYADQVREHGGPFELYLLALFYIDLDEIYYLDEIKECLTLSAEKGMQPAKDFLEFYDMYEEFPQMI